MRRLKTEPTASVVRGHAFVQNLHRGHHESGDDALPVFRRATAFDELRSAV
jgi:IS6 family transposase